VVSVSGTSSISLITFTGEKMSDGDIVAQAFRHALGDRAQGDAGGIGADHRAVAAQRFKPFEQGAFGIEVLDHRLADPVVIGDLGEVVERAQLDPFRGFRRVDRRRAAVDDTVH
jgi:hypothetical protein